MEGSEVRPSVLTNWQDRWFWGRNRNMCRNCFSCSVVNADFVGAYTLFTVVLVYWRDGEIAVQPMSCYRTVSYQVLCFVFFYCFSSPLRLEVTICVVERWTEESGKESLCTNANYCEFDDHIDTAELLRSVTSQCSTTAQSTDLSTGVYGYRIKQD